MKKSTWLDFFRRSGNLEIAMRRAETWNEGTTGKRFKANPTDFVTLTYREMGKFTVSGEERAVKEFVYAFQVMGLFQSIKKRKMENGKFYIYCETPSRKAEE